MVDDSSFEVKLERASLSIGKTALNLQHNYSLEVLAFSKKIIFPKISKFLFKIAKWKKHNLLKFNVKKFNVKRQWMVKGPVPVDLPRFLHYQAPALSFPSSTSRDGPPVARMQRASLAGSAGRGHDLLAPFRTHRYNLHLFVQEWSVLPHASFSSIQRFGPWSLLLATTFS